MLRRLGSHVVFVAIFAISMLLLLVLTLEAFALIFGQGGIFAFPWGRLDRLQGAFYSVIIFLVISGFLPTYAVAYSIFLRKFSWRSRVLFSISLFVVAFIFFWMMVSDWSLNSEIWLIVPGVLSVFISDFIAEIASGMRGRGLG